MEKPRRNTENRTQKVIILIIMITIMSNIAQAVIIESTTANQIVYKNGELITIILEANAENLQVTADFTAVDSNYNKNSVVIETAGTTYTISYPITFSNTKGDNLYNSIITVYDPQTSTTSTVTYGIKLANAENKQTSTQEITLTVNDENMINVKSGTIQVCSSTKCTTFTQADYDAARNIYISSGKVSLSNLTYNQIIDEITAKENVRVDAQLKDYLIQLAGIKQTLDAGLYDLKVINKDMLNTTEHFKNDTKQMIATGNRNNLLTIIGVFLMILGALYMIYLRTETTWFIGPK